MTTRLNREQKAFIKHCQTVFDKRIDTQLEIERLQKLLKKLKREDAKNTKLLDRYGIKDLVLVYSKGPETKDDKQIFNELGKSYEWVN